MFAILFDLDGTLVDSDSVHFEAWQLILTEVKPEQPLIDRAFFDRHISGRLNADITRDLVPHLSAEEQAKLAETKELLFRRLAEKKLRPTEGLEKILGYIKENRSKLKIGNWSFDGSSTACALCAGLATNAPRLVVDFELGVLKLDEKTFFDAALVAEEFGIGKWTVFSLFLPSELRRSFQVNLIRISTWN